MPRFVKKNKRTPKKGRRLKNLSPWAERHGMKGQLPNRQTQRMVGKAWQYFTREWLNGGPLFPVSQNREESIEFDGKRETLRKVLHDIGFYAVRRDGTLYLKETPRIAAVRFSFLKLFKKYYDEGQYARKYLDETWIFEHGSGVAYIWSNGKWECQRSKVKAGGARYIIAHCGGQDGFIPGASLVYHSKNKPEPGDDYHGYMNGTIFSRCMERRVIPNTKEKSVFIMDNASYHKFQ
ncbi:Cytochrome P450 6a9, partial [Frankliniella fusca]